MISQELKFPDHTEGTVFYCLLVTQGQNPLCGGGGEGEGEDGGGESEKARICSMDSGWVAVEPAPIIAR